MDDHVADGVPPWPGAASDDVARILSRAFADDPLITWMFDDPGRQRIRIEQAFQTWIRRTYAPKNAVVGHPSGHAAACWAAPARWRLTVIQQLRLLPSMAHVFGVGRLPAVVSGMQLIADTHPSDHPHWYLGFLGTEPEHQRQGLGTALLRHGLARCDRDQKPAYLETARPETLVSYQRFGFAVHHELQLPDGLVVWGLWRNPEPNP